MSKIYLNTIGFKSGMAEYHTASKQITKRISQRYEASRRARKYGVEDTLTTKQWTKVIIQSEGCCFYCGKDVGAENLGIDHFIPLCAGGNNTLENVVPSCFPCNAKKGYRIPESMQIYQHVPVA